MPPTTDTSEAQSPVAALKIKQGVAETNQDAIVKMKHVITAVSRRCGFVLAEALCLREDGLVLVQSGASWCEDSGAELFHKFSIDFVFPLSIGVPGRCFTTQQTLFHNNVTLLPETIFLRAEMAAKADLQGCVAIPAVVEESKQSFVVLLFTRHPITSEDFVREAIEIFQSSLNANQSVPTLKIPPPADLSTVNAKNDSNSPPLSQSRSWLRCEIALSKSSQFRTSDDMEDILKFSRKLEFFKHMAENAREALCREMRLVTHEAGAVLDKSWEGGNEPNTWRILVQGRVAAISIESLSSCPVWFFECGQTFARSYLNLFATEGVNTARMETVMASKCLELQIPPWLQASFRMWTRPLCYEELSRYFFLSINEAAERLGICPSAIKRICRRQGLHRWPHRKMSSMERQIASIEHRLKTEGADKDKEAYAALRRELMEAVRSKILAACNITSSKSVPGEVDDADEAAAFDATDQAPAAATSEKVEKGRVGGGPIAGLAAMFNAVSKPATPSTPTDHLDFSPTFSESAVGSLGSDSDVSVRNRVSASLPPHGASGGGAQPMVAAPPPSKAHGRAASGR